MKEAALQIVREEWHRIVREFGLRPGTPAETVTARILERIAAIPADHSDTTCYVERSRVREICMGVADEHVHVTEGILSDIDNLPILTAADLLAVAEVKTEVEAALASGEREGS